MIDSQSSEHASREKPASTFSQHALEALFRPRAIAIVGASQDDTKIGGRPVRFLRQYGFAGKVFPVNPKAAEVQGFPAYPSIDALPEAPDLAVIAVPAEAAPRAVADCAKKGVRAAVILSSGFAELGEAGERLQDELRAIARRTGLRIVGPNCLGAIGVADKAIATFSIVIENGLPLSGPVGLVSQSGNLGSYAMQLARERGLGLSHFLTTGNECDVDVADGLSFMARDPQTRVILLILETCRSAPRLLAALEEARAAGKPVIALKIGSSAAGQQAAASHTGALAGSDAVFDAVLRRAGVVRVSSLEQLVATGHASAILAPRGFPKGRNLAVVTASGGFGVLLADAASAAGLALPALSQATQDRIRAIVPYAAPRNPVDATAQMSSRPDLLETILTAVIEDDGADMVLLMMASALSVPRLRETYMRALASLKARYPEKLVLLCTHGEAEHVQALNAVGYPTVDGIEAACRTLSALAALGETKTLPPPLEQPAPAPLDPEAFRNEVTAKQALAAAGLPVLPEVLAATPQEAGQVAETFSAPVVIKIVSPDIAHKTEIGGVAVGIEGREAVEKTCAAMLERLRDKAPTARFDGFLVAPLLKGGSELILGTTRDPIFGPAVMVGFGGIFAEIIQDVAVCPAPVAEDEAMAMLRSLKGFPLLDGARGRPRADLAAGAKAISALSHFAARHADDVSEIDINPFVLLDEGKGAVALDALIVPAKDPSHGQH